MTDPTMIRVVGYGPITVDTQTVRGDGAYNIDLSIRGYDTADGDRKVELTPLEALAVAEALTRHARHSLEAGNDG